MIARTPMKVKGDSMKYIPAIFLILGNEIITLSVLTYFAIIGVCALINAAAQKTASERSPWDD